MEVAASGHCGHGHGTGFDGPGESSVIFMKEKELREDAAKNTHEEVEEAKINKTKFN